ncbi:type VII secretion EsaA-like protein [Fictibacillus barbaricus]|uniref:Type VII secretion EsaA-like protein n=2 Tax=Fictibacillus barbaricus TaxID=182136 RepID=A0ABU1U4N8_9BACL|nr:type VII secretion EsaA-like protein [Fictibacillus barbaricus]
MQAKVNGTRSIAIVNEDLGSDEENNLQLGREVPAILEDGSKYKWTVVSRSAAENGMKDNKYDAVVYIPSNFTSNVLTYEEAQPTKADFQYNVQTQLNAVNKEKVLRELDYAGNRINKQMSSLYWNYVSQDMKKVRTEFDRILEKEIEFQTTMVSFYSPSSKALADELQRQKDMLVQLQSTMKQADETSPQRANNLEQFEQNLSSFVQYVEKYKEYQGNQQKLLNEAQQKSLLAINTGGESFAAKQSESKRVFSEQGDKFITSMAGINDLLKGTNESITNLNNERLKQVDRQIADMSEINNDIIDAYIQQQRQTELVQLEEKIRAARGQLGKGEEGGTGQVENPADPGDPSKAKFDEELNELTAIGQQSSQIKDMLLLIPDPKPENVNKAIEDLTALATRVTDVRTKIETKANEDGWKIEYANLKKLYDSLLVNNQQLINANQKLKEGNSKLFGQIREKEQDISKRNSNLSGLFSTPFLEGSLEGTLAYYGLLSQYESVLIGTDNGSKNIVLSNEELKNRVHDTLSVNEEEQGKWDDLQTKFPTTQQEMKGLGDSFSTFKKDYQLSLEDQQKEMMNNIGSIEESANTVLTKLQEIQTNEPAQTGEGSVLVTNQQNINHEVIMINELMDSLGERQANVVNYTGELQGRVNSVQNDANVLNEKWVTNVKSTKLVRDDVFNVLGNTYVDGQNNGYVYDFLANPLKIDAGDNPQVESESVKAIPPVVILIVILISSLLIGYFSHYFSQMPFLVKLSIFGLLNLIVGLVISLFGLEIYSLSNNISIQFSIFTILLLTAASTFVRTAFNLGNFIGWIGSVALVLFFVSPLLALAAPNFLYEDPMSAVYMSIQYGEGSDFMMSCFFLIGVIAILSILPYTVRLWKKPPKKMNTDKANEAY